MDTARVRLRALSGTPLDDPSVRDVVIATARAIAERTGVEILELTTDPEGLTVNLAIDKLAAMGFLAELRRLTNAWYEGKYRDGPLWGTPPPE